MRTCYINLFLSIKKIMIYIQLKYKVCGQNPRQDKVNSFNAIYFVLKKTDNCNAFNNKSL